MGKALREKHITISTRTVKSMKEMNFILSAITALIKVNKKDCDNGILDIKQEEKDWPKTRDIAEYCQFSIYKTRHLLVKLEKKGFVKSSSKMINNSLHWHVNCHLFTENNQDAEN